MWNMHTSTAFLGLGVCDYLFDLSRKRILFKVPLKKLISREKEGFLPSKILCLFRLLTFFSKSF